MYAEESYWGVHALYTAARDSGMTREEIVAKAMAIQPCASVYATTETYGFGADIDWGLAMAWSAIQGEPMSMGALVARVDRHGWGEVEACFGTDLLPLIKEWHAAMEDLQVIERRDRWVKLDNPVRVRFNEVADRLIEAMKK